MSWGDEYALSEDAAKAVAEGIRKVRTLPPRRDKEVYPPAAEGPATSWIKVKSLTSSTIGGWTVYPATMSTPDSGAGTWTDAAGSSLWWTPTTTQNLPILNERMWCRCVGVDGSGNTIWSAEGAWLEIENFGSPTPFFGVSAITTDTTGILTFTQPSTPGELLASFAAASPTQWGVVNVSGQTFGNGSSNYAFGNNLTVQGALAVNGGESIGGSLFTQGTITVGFPLPLATAINGLTINWAVPQGGGGTQGWTIGLNQNQFIWTFTPTPTLSPPGSPPVSGALENMTFSPAYAYDSGLAVFYNGVIFGGSVNGAGCRTSLSVGANFGVWTIDRIGNQYEGGLLTNATSPNGVSGTDPVGNVFSNGVCVTIGSGGVTGTFGG